jgi:hypothetical protein
MIAPTLYHRFVVVLAAACVGTVCLAAAPPPRGKATLPQKTSQQAVQGWVRDPHVVAAGGGACACRGGACQCGHHQAAGHGHHPDCRDGRCDPHCPVRPQHYGFYGTEWRRWSGQGTMTASDDRAATPALPPRLAVPGPDQESMRSSPDESGDADGAGSPTSGAAMPQSPTPSPSREPASRRVEPRALPPAEPKAFSPPPVPAPAAEPAASVPLPADDNLFNNSGAREKARRKFAVGPGEAARQKAEAAVQATSHEAPVEPRAVPRVSFDPRAEARRLRAEQR